MYCPYCGEKMTLTDHGWYCAKGRMHFAPAFATSVLALMAIPPTTPPSTTGGKASSRYCMRCQEKMLSYGHGIELQCPECGLYLSPTMVSQLVEFHHHS